MEGYDDIYGTPGGYDIYRVYITHIYIRIYIYMHICIVYIIYIYSMIYYHRIPIGRAGTVRKRVDDSTKFPLRGKTNRGLVTHINFNSHDLSHSLKIYFLKLFKRPS